jgi:hypothetical protein
MVSVSFTIAIDKKPHTSIESISYFEPNRLLRKAAAARVAAYILSHCRLQSTANLLRSLYPSPILPFCSSCDTEGWPTPLAGLLSMPMVCYQRIPLISCNLGLISNSACIPVPLIQYMPCSSWDHAHSRLFVWRVGPGACATPRSAFPGPHD